ncbi:MAG: hypothetical protein R3B38_01560 [Patescibacteria group bacterium]
MKYGKRNRLANYMPNVVPMQLLIRLMQIEVTDLIVWNGAPTLSQAAVQIAKQKELRYKYGKWYAKTLQLDLKV